MNWWFQLWQCVLVVLVVSIVVVVKFGLAFGFDGGSFGSCGFNGDNGSWYLWGDVVSFFNKYQDFFLKRYLNGRCSKSKRYNVG